MRVVSAHGHGRSLVGKFALVLLCLVVLELVLIGHQVQPVKALKKKIYLKKLKKILPFLALVKPKKKLILVPIPIPMYNNQQSYAPNYHGQAHHPNMHTAMNGEGSSPPMSFMMMTEPNLMSGPSVGRPASSSSLGGSGGFEPAPLPESTATSNMMMMMPSMTMTIQSDGTGTMSAIELNASGRPVGAVPSGSVSSLSPANNTVSGALLAGQPSKWLEQQQLQQYDYDLDEQFPSGGNLINEPPQQAHPQQQQQQQQADAGGEHYYSSPWQSSSRPPPQLLASPAKHLRKERLRQQQPQQQRHVAAQTATKPRQQRNQHTIAVDPTSGRLTNQGQRQQQQQQQQRPGKQRQPQRLSAPVVPVLIAKNQWQPSSAPIVQQASGKGGRQTERMQQQERHLEEPRAHAPPQLTREQEQQISRALEQESLVQVGPARMLPIYQSPSGRLSMTPPPPPLSPLPRVGPATSSSTTVGSVGPTSQDTASSHSGSFDDHETSAPPTQPDHSNAEVQTIGSSSGSTSFFHSPAVGDTPTASEYPAHAGGSPSSPANPGLDGQHDPASEPTTMSSDGGRLRETVTATTAPATTSSSVAFVSSGRLVSPTIKGGGRIQSSPPPPPQQQPLGDGTKNNQAGALDSSSY